MNSKHIESSMPVKAYTLFEVFPFSILLDDQLKLKLVGKSLRQTIPGILGTAKKY